MQWSVFLLLLMGQCSFFMCHLHEYHFVEERKNWTEAQKYCREHHTDLATVSDMTDMERLPDSAQSQDGAWIGLYSLSKSTAGEDNRMWHWSLPGVEFNDDKTKWAPGEPNDNPFPENCVCIRNNLWLDFHCTKHEHVFICYDERKTSNEKFKLIEDEKTWPQAQSYCREHHTDLVSGHQQLEDGEFKNEYKTDKDVWIGLFRDSWRWSDGSSFSFRYWDLESFRDEDSSKKCTVTLLDGKWSSDECEETKPFFCYDDKMILIKENMTWDDAIMYCRVNYCDLVSITNLNEQRWVQEKAKKADSPYVWLGLRYTCSLGFWFWVDEEMVTYKNWVTDVPGDDCDMSGAMDRGGEHKWFKKNDNEKFNFICSVCQSFC